MERVPASRFCPDCLASTAEGGVRWPEHLPPRRHAADGVHVLLSGPTAGVFRMRRRVKIEKRISATKFLGATLMRACKQPNFSPSSSGTHVDPLVPQLQRGHEAKELVISKSLSDDSCVLKFLLNTRGRDGP